jgi:hypothetical protein
MILHDWFDWSNSGVGIAGLGLTLWAVWQATGAKRAATEAREAVYQGNAVESLEEIVKLAEQISESLLLEWPSVAAVRARDLVARIPRDRARFERFLAADSDTLKALESIFQQLAIRLSSARFLEGSDEPQRTIDEVFEAKRELNAVYGRLQAQIMRRGHE